MSPTHPRPDLPSLSESQTTYSSHKYKVTVSTVTALIQFPSAAFMDQLGEARISAPTMAGSTTTGTVRLG